MTEELQEPPSRTSVLHSVNLIFSESSRSLVSCFLGFCILLRNTQLKCWSCPVCPGLSLLSCRVYLPHKWAAPPHFGCSLGKMQISASAVSELVLCSEDGRGGVLILQTPDSVLFLSAAAQSSHCGVMNLRESIKNQKEVHPNGALCEWWEKHSLSCVAVSWFSASALWPLEPGALQVNAVSPCLKPPLLLWCAACVLSLFLALDEVILTSELSHWYRRCWWSLVDIQQLKTDISAKTGRTDLSFYSQWSNCRFMMLTW